MAPRSEVPGLDEAIGHARACLVENAPPVSVRLDPKHGIEIIRLRLRSSYTVVTFCPDRLVDVLGFRAFVDPYKVMVASVSQGQAKLRSIRFDAAKWICMQGYASFHVVSCSWLCPLHVRLEPCSANSDPMIDLVVVYEDIIA